MINERRVTADTLGTNEVLRVTAEGEFIWHPEADAMIEEGNFGSSPAMPHILRQLRRIAELEAELQEQARVNGMGGEREAALLAQIQELKDNLEKKSTAIQRIWKERDELRKVNWAAYEIDSLEFDYQPHQGGKNVLSCGCRSEYLGSPAVWDVDGGTEHGAICERHFYEWQARPEGGV